MRILFLFLIIIVTPGSYSQVFDMVVAKAGSGAYRTIQSAIGRIPSNRQESFLVYIKNGIYNEKIELPSDKTFVSLIGESVDGVIITWDDYQGKDGMSGAASYTFLAAGNDLYMENLTIRNTAGPVGQAVALRTTGQRQVIKNCRLTGFQDTYYAHSGRQYNLNCYIEGATDFIYGDATAVFDTCVIHCVEGGQYITAPADTKLISEWPDKSPFYHGLLFTNCLINAAESVPENSYYMGRPWQPNASSVYINCSLGNHIKPEGWSAWGETNNHLTGFFAEYRSVDTAGNLKDTTSRVSWSHQLKEPEVDTYYNLNYFLKKDDIAWDPVPVTVAPEPPPSLSGDRYSVAWSEVPGVAGYVIIRNDSTIGFSEDSSFDDITADPAVYNNYIVRSVSTGGALSRPSENYTVEPTGIKQVNPEQPEFELLISNEYIRSEKPVSIKIYSVSGMLVLSGNNMNYLSLLNLGHGIYVARIQEKSCKIFTRKITR